MTGLLMMAPLVLGGGLAQAQAIALPAHAIPGIQQHLNLHGVHQKKAKRKGNQLVIHGCPKLVAKELHIVRAVPQPGHPDHYSFILNGTIENRGLTGQASAGFNVSRKLNGRVVHRVALSLFEKQVRHQQRFDLNRDFHPSGTLHVPIQSQAISRVDASHSTFELSVTNLSNHQGKCSVYNPTVATVSSGKVRQALPAQLHGGVSQQVGTLKKNGASAARKPLFGRSKPVTRRGGKSLLSPQAKGGTRHLLGGGHTIPPRIAGIRLDSVTPTITTAGASVTVHGQFPGVSMSDSRFEYNLFLYPRGGSFRDDALMHITHVSMTALTATVPNHNPGNFLLRIDTRVRGNDFATPTRSNSIPITIRRSLGASGFAPKPMFGPGSGRPVTGPHGTSLTDRAQMKLTLLHMTQNNEIIRNGTKINLISPVEAQFFIDNKGTAVGFVTVQRMLGSSPVPSAIHFDGYSSLGAAGVAPSPASDGSKIIEIQPGGFALVTLKNIIVQDHERDMGFNLEGGLHWHPMFALRTKTNAPYSDSNMTDNVVSGGDIPVRTLAGLTVLPIPHSKVLLTESPYGGGQWDDGTVHPVSLDFTVKIKNNGRTSAPHPLLVIVKGTGENDPGGGIDYRPSTMHRIGSGSCDKGVGSHYCTIRQVATIPSLRPGQIYSAAIHIDHIPHTIVLVKNHMQDSGVKEAIGPFMCGRGGIGGSVEITAEFTDDRRGDRNNNARVIAGRFGQANSQWKCTLE